MMTNSTNINYSEIDLFLKNEFQYNPQNPDSEIKESTPVYTSITNYITSSDDILQEKIRKTIITKKLDEVAIYKKADVDRKLFSKIRTQPDYHPNKNTILKLCLAMNLHIYDVITVNQILDHYGENVI